MMEVKLGSFGILRSLIQATFCWEDDMPACESAFHHSKLQFSWEESARSDDVEEFAHSAEAQPGRPATSVMVGA